MIFHWQNDPVLSDKEMAWAEMLIEEYLNHRHRLFLAKSGDYNVLAGSYANLFTKDILYLTSKRTAVGQIIISVYDDWFDQYRVVLTQTEIDAAVDSGWTYDDYRAMLVYLPYWEVFGMAQQAGLDRGV